MILVLGATGRIGSELTRQLLAESISVRCLVRDLARAQALLGDGPSLAVGSLQDVSSLSNAMRDVDAVFIASPIEPAMAALQLNAIKAARDSGVARIVKLSGSDWTMQAANQTRVGAAHAQVEAAIVASGLSHALIRPNAVAQTMWASVPAQVRSQDQFTLAIGSARISFTDVRDIAQVAAVALRQPNIANGIVAISGPRALSGFDLANAVSTLLGRTIAYQPLSIEASLTRLQATGESAYVLAHRREVLDRISAGAAATISDQTARLLGQPARDPLAWLACAIVQR